MGGGTGVLGVNPRTCGELYVLTLQHETCAKFVDLAWSLMNTQGVPSAVRCDKAADNSGSREIWKISRKELNLRLM